MHRPGTPTLVAALSAGRAPNTYSTYNSAWKAFMRFAEQNNINPLRASQLDICHYLEWLARKGTVALSNGQIYLSAINAVYTDLGLPPPARGELVARVKQGLGRMQVDTRPAARSLALPAVVALAWHDAVVRENGADLQLKRLRNLLFGVLTFLTASRPVSIVALPYNNVLLDPSALMGLVVYRQEVKTVHDMSTQVPGRVALSFPTTRFLPLIKALRTFQVRQRAALPNASYFFHLPGDRFVEPAEANGNLASDWVADAINFTPHRPPTGAQWTSRSLRSGAASACEAAGVPRSKTEFLGGWAPNSESLVNHYIDPATQHSPAGEFFFNHLTSRWQDGNQSKPL